MPILRLLVVLAAAGLALGACGVRGDPEPPPGGAATRAAEPTRPVVAEEAAVTAPELDVFDDEEETERVIESQRRSIYPPASDSFVLDPLL